MTGMTPERLAEIRARAEAATEGPWTWASRMTVDTDAWAVFDPQDRPLASNHDGWSPDAIFIAHARTDIPALLAEVERLREGHAWLMNQWNDAEVDVDALAQQIEKVRALHQPWDDGPQPYCTHDREPWPCPTERALGAR